MLKKEKMKLEKPPRNIVFYNPNDPDKHYEAQFSLALSEWLKTLPFYGCGFNMPKQDEVVAAIFADAKESLVAGDASAYDSSQQSLVLLCLVAMFSIIFHQAEEAGNIAANLVNAKVTTRAENGVATCKVENEMASGRGFTTTINTMLMILICYIANRRKGDTSEQAYNKLGVYSGDDSITKDTPIERITEAAAVFGVVITLESELRKDTPGMITFLGRIYVGLADGITTSFYDLRRFVSRNWITAEQRPLGQIVAGNVVGLEITDSNTPLIREYCALARRTLGADDFGNAYADITSNALYHAKDGFVYQQKHTPEHEVLLLDILFGADADKITSIIGDVRESKDILNLEIPESHRLPRTITAKYDQLVGTDKGIVWLKKGDEWDGNILIPKINTEVPQPQKAALRKRR
jgi:hypothetical protein